MKMNKRILASMATATALAGAGFVIADNVQVPAASTQTVKAAWVNDYIKNNNIKPVNIEYRQGSFNENFNYRNGYGKPEGVVIHDTENPNDTAESEFSFFNNNWPTVQSYVHAVTDYKQIINMHDTGTGVWGAGPAANYRFIQIELCSSAKNEDQFARSVENQAYYVASKLIQYGLTPSRASADGSGTVWSHHDVTKYLGGTNHVDPDTYFPKWGYSMDEMYQLVVDNYNDLVNGKTPGGDGDDTPKPEEKVLYVTNKNGAKAYSVPGGPQNGQTYKYGSGWKVTDTKVANGVTYYQIATNTWLSAYDVSSQDPNGGTNGGNNGGGQTDNGETTVNGVFTVNGNQAQVYNMTNEGKMKESYGKRFGTNSKWRSDRKITIDGTLYYRVSTNEWLKANDGSFK